jgi:geranylgeranyl pyrophosphate synthase
MGKIKAKMMEGGRIDDARQRAQILVDMALKEIDYLPESSAKSALTEIAHMVIERDH